MSSRTRAAALAALIAVTLPLAQAATTDPGAKHAPHTGAPASLNGGVGKEDAARMHAAAKDYSLQIELSERRDNEFVAGARVKIVDVHGKTVFQRSESGPILLVRLAPGTYRVTATVDGRHETQTATVAPHGTEHMYFHWKGMARAEPAHDARPTH